MEREVGVSRKWFKDGRCAGMDQHRGWGVEWLASMTTGGMKSYAFRVFSVVRNEREQQCMRVTTRYP